MKKENSKIIDNRIKITDHNNGNLSIDCHICGKPIVKSNEFGMYCEDMCGLKEDKEAPMGMLKDLMKQFLP